MKVLHLSHTDGGSGAGRAAYRIHRSLLGLGFSSKMLVADKQTSDSSVRSTSEGVGREWARLCEYVEGKSGRYLARPGAGLFSPARAAHFRANTLPALSEFDVICLYWITGALLRPEGLSGISQPIIWRLSDVWPFTGGCHYPGPCVNFEDGCGQCPKLKRPGARDASKLLFERKKRAWRDLDLTIVAPSTWMAGLAARSALFRDLRIVPIATGIDTEVFAPRDREVARSRLGIPTKARLIVFGADGAVSDPRKGLTELTEALHALSEQTEFGSWHVAVFGSREVPPLPFPTSIIGRVSNLHRLAELYSSADVVAVPSREDNLPQVALEALACGTPVVAFRVGGLSDAILHRNTGWLAPQGDSQDFAAGLLWAATSGEKVRAASRDHLAKHFSLPVQMDRYADLMRELAERAKRPRK